MSARSQCTSRFGGPRREGDQCRRSEVRWRTSIQLVEKKWATKLPVVTDSRPACHYHGFRRSAPSARSRRHAPAVHRRGGQHRRQTGNQAAGRKAAVAALFSVMLIRSPILSPVLAGPPQRQALGWQRLGIGTPALRLSGQRLGFRGTGPSRAAEPMERWSWDERTQRLSSFLNAIPCRSYSVPVTPHPEFQERRIALRKFDQNLLLRMDPTRRRV